MNFKDALIAVLNGEKVTCYKIMDGSYYFEGKDKFNAEKHFPKMYMFWNLWQGFRFFYIMNGYAITPSIDIDKLQHVCKNQEFEIFSDKHQEAYKENLIKAFEEKVKKKDKEIEINEDCIECCILKKDFINERIKRIKNDNY